MSERLLSSAEVAELLGVSPASIKRWADAGVLPCVKTAGQHRRFRKEEVDRFRQASGPELTTGDQSLGGRGPAAWADELLADEETGALEASLLAVRAELGAWWRVADRLGPALTELGARWERGELSVSDEHRASERFSRAVARLCAWMPAAAQPPRCLLATAAGDEHTMGLSLVELCLCERAWAPVWIGRSAPVDDVAEAVTRLDVRLCALSASAYSSHPRKLAEQAEQMGLACASYRVQLVLGGSGAWPERPVYGRVIRDFATFTELLATLSGV